MDDERKMNENTGAFKVTDGHSIEGMGIRCGKYFSVVRNGRCSECGEKITLKGETKEWFVPKTTGGMM